MQKQPNSAYCFVCGLENVAGVKVSFYETVSAEGSAELLARFSGQPCHQGYPGRMHGGVLTGVLDETIARSINYGSGVNVERWGITAELTTRFLHPVPLETASQCPRSRSHPEPPHVHRQRRDPSARRRSRRSRRGQIPEAAPQRHLRSRRGTARLGSVSGRRVRACASLTDSSPRNPGSLSLFHAFLTCQIDTGELLTSCVCPGDSGRTYRFPVLSGMIEEPQSRWKESLLGRRSLTPEETERATMQLSNAQSRPRWHRRPEPRRSPLHLLQHPRLPPPRTAPRARPRS